MVTRHLLFHCSMSLCAGSCRVTIGRLPNGSDRDRVNRDSVDAELTAPLRIHVGTDLVQRGVEPRIFRQDDNRPPRRQIACIACPRGKLRTLRARVVKKLMQLLDSKT